MRRCRRLMRLSPSGAHGTLSQLTNGANSITGKPHLNHAMFFKLHLAGKTTALWPALTAVDMLIGFSLYPRYGSELENRRAKSRRRGPRELI